jgi:hypothetical protein
MPFMPEGRSVFMRPQVAWIARIAEIAKIDN